MPVAAFAPALRPAIAEGRSLVELVAVHSIQCGRGCFTASAGSVACIIETL